MKHSALFSGALTFAFAAALSCQSGPDADPAPMRGVSLAPVDTIPIHTQAADEGLDYGLWAAGRGYKVGFHDGMQFVPYLGRDYPDAQSVRWRTTSAKVGEVELCTAPPRLSHSSLRAEYDLGGLVEAYDVRAEGVEQTFVLATAPQSGGDLVIRGAVASQLRAGRGGGHSAIEFADASGRVLARYGAATAIDARGRCWPMTTTCSGSNIELRLDGACLAAAQLPLTVDPLLAAVAVGSGLEIEQVAVTHDPIGASGNVWIAEVRYASATDSDLRLLRVDDNGQNPVVVYTDLSILWASSDASLGVNRPAGRTLLAFTRHFVGNDTKRVRMHLHERTDMGLGTAALSMTDTAGRNQWRPVVGSELSPVSFTSLLVAFQVESTGAFANSTASAIYGAEVALGGSGSIVSQFAIADTSTDHERPSVAKVAIGPARVWTVAYQQFVNFVVPPSVSDWNVVVRRVDAAGPVGLGFAVDTNLVDHHQMAPRLAGADNRLMLFYTDSTIAESSSKPLTDNGHRIRGVRLDWTPGGWTTPHGSKLLQSNNDARLLLAGADYDRNSTSHWCLSFRSSATQAVYVRTYGYTGDQLSTDVVDQPVTGLGTSVAGGVAFNSNDDEFVVAYGMDEPGIGSESRLRRRTYPALFPWSTTGTGCTAATMSWFGPQWIGTEGCGVAMNGVPAGSLSVVVIVAAATASLQLFGIGGVHDGCWLLVPLSGPDYLGMLNPSIGTNPTWDLPLPASLDTQYLRFQGVVLDPAFGEFFTTSRLNVAVGK